MKTNTMLIPRVQLLDADVHMWKTVSKSTYSLQIQCEESDSI